VVNPHHIKNVPGRKTDQIDSEWIADLLQHGLLRGSFVPPPEIRQLRDLTRPRARMRRDLATLANRIQKVLEDANIKLGSVASDVLGVSGRQMLKALISGQQNPKQLADLARGKLRDKIESLELALDGDFTNYHPFQLKLLLDLLEYGEAKIAELQAEIDRLLNQATSPLHHSVDLWKTIPGIDHFTASMLVAEIGSNMDKFPDAHHLASWAGLCPGNNAATSARRPFRRGARR
jgi:transposase